MKELIIKNVRIIDGSGAPSYIGDIGAEDGKLVLSPSGDTKCEIDGTGLCVSPGFIDSHSHADYAIETKIGLAEEARLNQGVTTEVTGQCGSSCFPAQESIDTFFENAEKMPKAGNYAFLAGHGAIRRAVMDCRSGSPSPAELERMKAHVREAMEKGCFGMSSGLIYVPGVFADTEELISLARETAPYGGIYATHMRSEADHIVEAVKEAIRVAETAGVPLVISHHKCMGKSNHGRSVETLALIHEAIARGVRITMDQYPYEATSTSLTTSVAPHWFTEGNDAFAERLADPAVRAQIKKEMTAEPVSYNCGYRNAGGFGGILVAQAPETPEAEGMTIEAYAKQLGKDPFETYFDLLAANRCRCNGNYFAMCDEDIDRIYLDENTCVGSDCLFGSASDHPHPRSYATFVRSIVRFHKERGLVTLEEAVRKQTSLTAERWGLPGKGLLKEGYDADLVLFDAETLADRATYSRPRLFAEGMRGVFVAGKCVFRDGKLTGEKPGRCIRHTV